MANLTVAEKTHWRDRIQARIDRRIEAITAGDPGLMDRIKQEAEGRALTSLGLAEFQAELDQIAAQRAALVATRAAVPSGDARQGPRGRRSTRSRKSTTAVTTPEITSGDHQAAGGPRGGAAGRARARPPGAQAPGREGEPARRGLAGDLAGPGPPALEQGRRAAGRRADPLEREALAIPPAGEEV